MSDLELTQLERAKSGEGNVNTSISKYLRYWYVFLACIAISVGTSYLLLKYMVPQYHISSTILIEQDDKNRAGTNKPNVYDINFLNASKNVDNEIEILKSKKLMEMAENISKERGFHKIRVISGVGVRNYYRKLGYELDDNGIYVEKVLV